MEIIETIPENNGNSEQVVVRISTDPEPELDWKAQPNNQPWLFDSWRYRNDSETVEVGHFRFPSAPSLLFTLFFRGLSSTVQYRLLCSAPIEVSSLVCNASKANCLLLPPLQLGTLEWQMARKKRTWWWMFSLTRMDSGTDTLYSNSACVWGSEDTDWTGAVTVTSRCLASSIFMLQYMMCLKISGSFRSETF